MADSGAPTRDPCRRSSPLWAVDAHAGRRTPAERAARRLVARAVWAGFALG
jgi:hypothetical protein